MFEKESSVRSIVKRAFYEPCYYGCDYEEIPESDIEDFEYYMEELKKEEKRIQKLIKELIFDRYPYKVEGEDEFPDTIWWVVDVRPGVTDEQIEEVLKEIQEKYNTYDLRFKRENGKVLVDSPFISGGEGVVGDALYHIMKSGYNPYYDIYEHNGDEESLDEAEDYYWEIIRDDYDWDVSGLFEHFFNKIEDSVIPGIKEYARLLNDLFTELEAL